MDSIHNEDIFGASEFSTLEIQWDPAEELAQMLSTAAAAHPDPGPPHGRSSHRRNRRRHHAESRWTRDNQRGAHVTILIATISVCAVCMLGWSFSYSYAQLRATASSVLPMRLAQWWPLTVYGPWLVAALSILRATVQSRSARRSWCVLLGASAMAVALCVSHSSHSLLSLVIFGIPPITALVCFWEIVGQVSSKVVRPRHAAQDRRGPTKPQGTYDAL
ncbi:DUF2637 domain-containing protein [Streptomyces sp. FXJ1.172]|uniref:DUF2637 domain-containing protein n=1 Tax=Streptomyces sp. FXJ1.172 TaxID=710705 RepID=UPI0007CFAABA|nr:DUF2637 domain-containing protein [Streptomyces sp. FXJ1.172]WEO96592.1 DUF2637 domain-containing protein [Streptomyces sp. FXJ1.172]